MLAVCIQLLQPEAEHQGTVNIMRDFKQLQVWEKAHHLVIEVYKVTKQFPAEELYDLTSQTRRAAASIPTNIAEGCGRDSEGDFRRFLQISMGSASELEYHFLLAKDLNFFDEKTYLRLEQQILEVKRMLAGFLKKLKTDR
jgi:four helix bundle protein